MIARRRFSGALVVTIALTDDDAYRCRVADPSDPSVTWTGTIDPPAFLTRALDSSEAFDDAARAALAFCADERGEIRAAYGPSAEHVGRSQRQAWSTEAGAK